MSDSTDLRPLFVDYANGAISAEQLQALEAALREDTDLRREFIEYMNIDSALGDTAALSEAELAEFELAKIGNGSTATAAGVSEIIAGTDDRPSQTYRVVALLGAVAATLLIAAFMWFASPGEHEQSPVATLVTDVDAVLFCHGQPRKDTELPAGEYRLERGLLHLQFAGGVMVYVEAPARFDAFSDKRVVLHSGRLSASVPPEGIGFTVETPEAEVIDFGTEFSVEVDSGMSEVHVFEGLVRVQPRAKKDGAMGESVDLRTSQAVKVEAMAEKPVEIELAKDRFIRTFDEPKLRYPRVIKQLVPVAYYRMPIRDRGLAAEPPQYSGVVLTGDGRRPPHARGVSNGGSLRVLADSTGRGGRVDAGPPLGTGKFTLALFAYLESSAAGGTLVTNMQGDQGNFAISLNERGRLHVSVRTDQGESLSVSSDSAFPLQTWRHLIVIADGEKLQIYENGQLVASARSSMLANGESDSLWFGTDAEGLRLWNGRIDELALFDRALSAREITDLHPAALEEMTTTK